MRDPIAVRTLTDGGQSADDIATELIGFVDQARTSLDFALYDVRLPGDVGDRVAGALLAAAARGVAMRIAYNADDVRRVPVPPPPRTEPEIRDAALAERMAAFVDEIRARYPDVAPPAFAVPASSSH